MRNGYGITAVSETATAPRVHETDCVCSYVQRLFQLWKRGGVRHPVRGYRGEFPRDVRRVENLFQQRAARARDLNLPAIGARHLV